MHIKREVGQSSLKKMNLIELKKKWNERVIAIGLLATEA